MSLQLDQSIFQSIENILNKSGVGAEMRRMIQGSLNAEAPTGEPFKWAHLTLLACECAGGTAEIALPGAVAMEFFALAADIFDDIQDQDHDDLPWRRIPEAQAISLASCLLMLGFEAASSIADGEKALKVCTALHRAGLAASDGQFREQLYESCPEISFEQYFELIGKKSGALTACACGIGAILAGVPAELRWQLEQFGIYFGIMNQIRNDYRDFLDFARKGDFARNKKTLPYVYLANIASGENAAAFQELAAKNNRLSSRPQAERRKIPDDKASEAEKELLAGITAAEGVGPYCAVMLELYAQKARDILEQMPVAEMRKEKLRRIVGESV